MVKEKRGGRGGRGERSNCECCATNSRFKGGLSGLAITADGNLRVFFIKNKNKLSHKPLLLPRVLIPIADFAVIMLFIYFHYQICILNRLLMQISPYTLHLVSNEFSSTPANTCARGGTSNKSMRIAIKINLSLSWLKLFRSKIKSPIIAHIDIWRELLIPRSQQYV